MEAKLWFVLLCSVVALFLYVIGYWRRKTGQVATQAVQVAWDKSRFLRVLLSFTVHGPARR